MTNMLTGDAMGVQELDSMSLVEVEGGSPLSDLAWALVQHAAECIMDNWGAFKSGVSDGYNNPV
jgi:hypothetical protein